VEQRSRIWDGRGIRFTVLVASVALAGGAQTPAGAVRETTPIVDSDAFLGEAVDARAADEVTCSYQPALTKPNAEPSESSFQYVLALPSDVTPNPSLDRPKDCSDGTTKQSRLARASLNLAVWHRKQDARLRYRTIAHTYEHRYTNVEYTVQAVRRFVSEKPESWWNGLGLVSRLQELGAEMRAKGWNVPLTKYIMLFHTSSQRTAGGDMLGVAYSPGKYAFSVRSYRGEGRNIRYGCATVGDTINGHEATHLLGVGHIGRPRHDLMHAPWGGRTFKSDPPIRWDPHRDDYHRTVRNHAFVIPQAVPTSRYATC
jgi:hypothetical protein